MRVLEINVDSGCGSTGRIASDIALGLKKQGHDVYVAYGRDFCDSGIDVYRIGSKLGIYSHVLRARLFDSMGFGSKKATIKFIAWVKNFDPDVIHLHNLHGYYINIRILFNYLKTCNKRIIWTLHDLWSFTGHCTYIDSGKCLQWKSNCQKCPRNIRKEYPRLYFCDRSKRNYRVKKDLFSGIPNLTIVTPSYWLKEYVKESFLKEYEVVVIHNGIDLNKFKHYDSDLRVDYGLSGKKIILGVASYWDRRKGFDDYIKLASCIGDDTRIVLIGLSKKQISLLPDNILGISRTESIESLAKWYSTADVFFNPTYEDNYPTTNLEAQACGTPVVTYRTGGSIESVPKDQVLPVGDYKGILNYKTPLVVDVRNDFDKNVALDSYLSLIVDRGK